MFSGAGTKLSKRVSGSPHPGPNQWGSLSHAHQTVESVGSMWPNTFLIDLDMNFHLSKVFYVEKSEAI